MRPVTLEAVCDRFEILLHRYSLFTAELPSRFKAWISAASESKQIFSTLESVCIEMFPQQLPPGRDGWILSAAMLALRHFIVQCKGVELSECGKGLRIFGELVPPPVVRPAPPVNGMLLVQTLSRNAVLQARVLELECRLDRRPKKDSTVVVVPESLEEAIAFLNESRAEAVDALQELKHGQQKRRRVEGPPLPVQQPTAERLIIPRRALSMAGYWNVDHNDLLQITTDLVQVVQARGGSVVRQREGMSICFLASERDLVLTAVHDVMGQKKESKK